MTLEVKAFCKFHSSCQTVFKIVNVTNGISFKQKKSLGLGHI